MLVSSTQDERKWKGFEEELAAAEVPDEPQDQEPQVKKKGTSTWAKVGIAAGVGIAIAGIAAFAYVKKTKKTNDGPVKREPIV